MKKRETGKRMVAVGWGDQGRPPPVGADLFLCPHKLAQSLTYQTFKNCQIGSDLTILPNQTACL